jgi:hypothetical protein
MYIGLMSNQSHSLNGPKDIACPHFVGARIGTTFTRTRLLCLWISLFRWLSRRERPLHLIRRDTSSALPSREGEHHYSSQSGNWWGCQHGISCCRARQFMTPSLTNLETDWLQRISIYHHSLAEMTEGSTTPGSVLSTSLTTPIMKRLWRQ